MTRRKLKGVFLALTLALSGGAAHADVVLIVSAQSSLKALSEDQIVGIYLGKLALLADGTRVVPIDLAENDGVRTNFYARFIGKSANQVRAYWSKLIFSGKGQPPRTISSVEALKKLIAVHPDYIGYIDRADLDPTVRAIAQGR